MPELQGQNEEQLEADSSEHPEVTTGRVLLVFVCPQFYKAQLQRRNDSGWKAPLEVASATACSEQGHL